MNNIGIALTGDDRQLLQILQQMESHLKNLNAVAVKAMDRTQTAAEQTARAMRDVSQAAAGASTAVNGTSRALNGYVAMTRDARVEANLLRQANRQLSMQMTDVVTSLASGMPAWMVFIQQGGQIKDSYDGVGAALRGVAGYLRTLINPVSALVALIGSLTAVAYSATKEFQEFNRVLVLSGNAAAITVGELGQMASRIDKVVGTQSRAAELLAIVASSGNIARESMERVTIAALELERAGGPAAEETIKQFEALGKNPVEASKKLQEQTGFLTLAIYKQVESLNSQGRSAEAAAVLAKAYLNFIEESTPKLKSQMNILQEGWQNLTDKIKEAIDAVKDFFRPRNEPEYRLEDVQRRRAVIEEGLRRRPAETPKLLTQDFERLRGELELLKKEEESLKEQIRLRKERLELDRRDREATDARMEWDRIAIITEEQRLSLRVLEIIRLGNKAMLDKQVIQERVNAEVAKTLRLDQEPKKPFALNTRSDADARINALKIEERLLMERLRLGRELTQGERERVTLIEQINLGMVRMTGPDLVAVTRQIAATDALRQRQKEFDDAAARNKAQTAENLRVQKEDEKATQERLDLEARAHLARLSAYDEAVEAAEKAHSVAIKNADDLVKAIESETAALGMTNEEREVAIALRDLEAKGIKKGTYAYDEYAKRIRQAIVDRNATRESIAQAEQLGREWKRITDQVGQSLADALMNGGKSAGEGIKRYFSTLILQPIIRAIVDPVARTIVSAIVDPVARTIVSALGLAGGASTAAAGTAGASAGTAAAGTAAGAGASAGNAAGAMGLLGSSGSIFGAGAAATMGGNFMGAMKSASAMMSGGATTQGLAMGAGAIAGVLGPIAIGQMLGRSISGGYSAIGGSSGSSAVNIGTAIGAIGGPVGMAIGAIIGGLVNRAFGRKLVDQGIQGTFGGVEGFTGTGYSVEKGGWFRSDRQRTSVLDADVSSLLGGGFTKLRASTSQMARDLGLAATNVDAFTKDIKVNLMGLSAEQAAEKLNAELATVADEMARLAAGSDATAQSLAALHQAVMSERAQLETRLLQLQGDTAELRRRERDALHETNRALYDRIIALEGERAALDALLSDTAALIQQQIGASQAAANAARQAADAYRTAGMTLIDTARALRGEVSPGASAAAAYRSALGAAQGGDVGAMQSLPGLAQAYAESLRGSARSRSQYLAGTRSIAAELEAVAGTAGGLGTTASIEAALLDVNTAVLRNLAEDVQNGALTVELLREHQTLLDRIASRLGDTGPLAERIDANVGATGNVIDAQLVAGDVLASSDSTLSRVLAKLSEPDANAAMLSQHVQSGNALLASRLDLVVQAISAQAAAQQAEIKRQQDLLKTQADLESAAAYFQTLQQNLSSTQQTLASTPTTVQTRIGTEPWYKGKGGIYRTDPNPAYATALDSVSAAQEALNSFAPQLDILREQIRALGGVPAFALGGLHSGGLRLVGERGPELEVTGPARYWSAADTTAMLGNSTRREEVLAAEIRALRAEVAGLRAETRATAENTGKTRRLWERVTRDGESMQVTDVTPAP